MGLRIKKSLNRRHIDDYEKEPNKKIFIVFEGEKTEIKYFEGLINYSKELGISSLIELVIMTKKSEYKGNSNPHQLIDLANRKIQEFNADDSKIYDKERDKFLIVMDRDRKDFMGYDKFISDNQNKFILAVTNPCFELWLLLHKENSVEEIINPNYDKILENNKVSGTHSFMSKIISDEYGMNTKSGMRFLPFKDHVLQAIEQEEKLEQDLSKLENRVGSNIGSIIKKELLDN